jgi:hypothetical protein
MREKHKGVCCAQLSRGVSVMKRRMALCVFLFLFGVLPLLMSLKNPRLEMLHGSDFVQLIASGICFGMGVGVLLGGRSFLGEEGGS